MTTRMQLFYSIDQFRIKNLKPIRVLLVSHNQLENEPIPE